MLQIDESLLGIEAKEWTIMAPRDAIPQGFSYLTLLIYIVTRRINI